MRKRLFTSAAVITVLAAISSASAADLGRPMYTKAPPAPPPPVFSWTGFYFGFNAGGKWVTNSDDDLIAGPNTVTFHGSNDSSWLAGGQIGYNWQAPGSPWVFGIEGDGDAQRFNKSVTVATDVFPFVAGDTLTVESNWQASLRGRIGYAAWDRALLYVTGGVAWTQVKGTVDLVGIGTFTDDKTVTGGTIGGGLEYAFTDNISLGIEGRYTFYGHEDFNNNGTLVVDGVLTPVRDRINLNTAEVMGKINFRFW